MYIDTHAHLYLEQFESDRNTIIERAISKNVKKIFLPNIDSSTTESMLNLVASFPDICFPMMGLHPCSVKENYQKELSHVKEELKRQKYYGIGETGIDLYWDKTFKNNQINSFLEQIELAYEYSLPIIIHSRDSLDLTIELISENQRGSLRGIFHCFNGNIEQCKKILDANFMMGLGGVITFKNAKLDDMIKYLPTENILLETDAPYLSPVPYRGKRNESSYIPLVAQKISEVKGISVNEIEEITSQNAAKLFGIDLLS